MKRTVFSDTRVLADGTLEVRLEKQIVEDGVPILRHPHRVVIHPGDDADAIMAGIFAHLAEGVSLKQGEPPIKFPVADDSAQRVKAIAVVEHTPERVAAHRARIKKDADEKSATFKSAAKVGP